MGGVHVNLNGGDSMLALPNGEVEVPKQRGGKGGVGQILQSAVQIPSRKPRRSLPQNGRLEGFERGSRAVFHSRQLVFKHVLTTQLARGAISVRT